MIAQSAETAEFTDCISAEGQNSPNQGPEYDTKRSDDEVPVILELRWMRISPLLPSLRGPFWPGVVAPDSVLSMG